MSPLFKVFSIAYHYFSPSFWSFQWFPVFGNTIINPFSVASHNANHFNFCFQFPCLETIHMVFWSSLLTQGACSQFFSFRFNSGNLQFYTFKKLVSSYAIPLFDVHHSRDIETTLSIFSVLQWPPHQYLKNWINLSRRFFHIWAVQVWIRTFQTKFRIFHPN